MLAQIDDGCAICRLVAQCVDPQIALRDLQIALRDRQIAQIRRLRLTYSLRDGVIKMAVKFLDCLSKKSLKVNKIPVNNYKKYFI